MELVTITVVLALSLGLALTATRSVLGFVFYLMPRPVLNVKPL